MVIRIYIIPRDFGFAPNPFHGVCTLATCKQRIREHINVGDYIIGIGSQTSRFKKRMIYYMQVEEKKTFDEYWSSNEFQIKKANINGSRKMQYGDNIYHKNGEVWLQDNSHHSNEDGSINYLNLNRDTKSEYVAISKDNWAYFGSKAVSLPANLESEFCPDRNRGHLKVQSQEVIDELVDYISTLEKGYLGKPINWLENGGFERYDGN